MNPGLERLDRHEHAEPILLCTPAIKNICRRLCAGRCVARRPR